MANRAGVAPSTVTLILNDRGEDLGIPIATRQRVQEAARDLGYYPNWHIRAIRTGRTGNFGLYLRSDQWGRPSGYWAMVLEALLKAVAAEDIRLLIHCAPVDCATEQAFARQAGGVVDGVIILHSGNDPLAQRLTETGLPAVEIGDAYSPLPRVAVDGICGIRAAVAHLKERGFKKPSFCMNHSTYIHNAQERERAFIAAAQEIYGLAESDTVRLEVMNGWEAFDQLCALGDRPDCVVCTADELGYELLTAAVRANVSVPQELGITGFDCLPQLYQGRVLTSVQTPVDEMAKLGVKKLIALIEGRPVEQNTVLPVELRVGDTT